MSVLAWRVGSARVEVVQGDIVDRNVDALANAANTDLWLGAGVAGFPLAECARIMVGEVAAALAAGSGALRLGRFVLFSPPARDRFAAAARAAWGDAEAA
jgi:O-acetyl-ADP-ribose deacetylase (regulator of RNase III)